MLLTGTVVLALVPSPQQAIAEGVFFDPDSPAGKEYALPLDQAREEAAEIGKSDGPAGEKAHLFGEGISRQTSGPGAGGAGTGAPRTKAPAENATRGREPRSQQHGRTAVSATSLSSLDDHYTLLSAILWVAAIVALGGIAGFALRVAQRPRPT